MAGQNILVDATEIKGLRTSPDGQLQSQKFNILAALITVASRKAFVAQVTCAVTLAGIGLSLVLPTRYTATTRIMTPQQAQPTAAALMSQLTAAPGAGQSAGSIAGGLNLKSPNDIYIGLLNSRPVADALIQQFNLDKQYRSADMTAARKELANNTRVSSEKSGFLVISITDRNRDQAAEMANAYTEQLRLFTKTLAVTEASQRRLFYEEQLKQAKEDLTKAQFSFEQIEQQKGLVQLDAQSKALIANLADLHAQASAKEVELRSLRSFSTEQNPAVQIAENQLASLRAQAARLQLQTRGSGSTQLGLQDVAGGGMEYFRAEHEFQYRQTLFDLLIKQYDAARMDEAKDAPVIQVVEKAIPPDRKSSPHRLQILALSVLLGLLSSWAYLATVSWLKSNPAASQSLRELGSALVTR